nr:sigma 54-interacting transcriptional regulator [Rahnella perminowiae]
MVSSRWSGKVRRCARRWTFTAGFKWDTTVLVRGESGTGKELIANAIHYNSPRAAAAPFVKFNRAALPDNLAGKRTARS